MLAARQRDVGAPELALGTDRHVLLVALGGHRQPGGESGRRHDDVELAVAGAALKRTADIARRLGPGAGQRAARGDDIALQLELVAVAGAEQGLIEAGAFAADGVSRLAANPFLRTILERDRAIARPYAGHAGERRRLRMCSRTRKTKCRAENSSAQEPRRGRTRYHEVIPSCELLTRSFPTTAAGNA